MADAPDQISQTAGVHDVSPSERVAASRVVLAHATSREDLHELLDALGLNVSAPGPAPRKRASVPATTTADAPINTTRERAK